MNFGFSIGKRSEEGRKDWKRYYDASVVAGETAFQRLAEAARNTGAYTSVGFSERGAVNGTLIPQTCMRGMSRRGFRNMSAGAEAALSTRAGTM